MPFLLRCMFRAKHTQKEVKFRVELGEKACLYSTNLFIFHRDHNHEIIIVAIPHFLPILVFSSSGILAKMSLFQI